MKEYSRIQISGIEFKVLNQNLGNIFEVLERKHLKQKQLLEFLKNAESAEIAERGIYLISEKNFRIPVKDLRNLLKRFKSSNDLKFAVLYYLAIKKTNKGKIAKKEMMIANEILNSNVRKKINPMYQRDFDEFKEKLSL